ncbi:MAG: flippase [Atribacterota bacterium]
MSKKLYSDLMSTGAASFFIKIIGIVGGILFPRLLGPEQWGLWSITRGFIGLLGPFAQLAMSTALVTYISKYKNDKEKVSSFVNSAYFMVIIFSLIISLVVISLSRFLAEAIFQDSRLTIFLVLGSITLFFNQLNIVNRDYFRGFKQFNKYNILKIVESFSKLVIPILFFVIFSYMAIYLAISHTIFLSIFSILVLIYLHRTENAFKIFKKPSKQESVMLLKFGIPLIFAATFLIVMRSIDRVLIGYFMESADVGIYSVAASLPLFIGGSFAVLSTVLLPTFSERENQGISSKKLISEMFSLLLFICIPLIVFIVLFSRDILWVVFGDEYTAGYLVLAIVSFELLLYGGYVLFRTSIQAKEQTGRIAIGIGLSALFNILLNITLIPVFGIEGAAIGTMISFIFLFVYLIYLVNINYDFSLADINILVIIFLTFVLIISGMIIISILTGFLSMIACIIFFSIIWYIFVHFSSPLWYKEMVKHFKERLNIVL